MVPLLQMVAEDVGETESLLHQTGDVSDAASGSQRQHVSRHTQDGHTERGHHTHSETPHTHTERYLSYTEMSLTLPASARLTAHAERCHHTFRDTTTHTETQPHTQSQHTHRDTTHTYIQRDVSHTQTSLTLRQTASINTPQHTHRDAHTERRHHTYRDTTTYTETSLTHRDVSNAATGSQRQLASPRTQDPHQCLHRSKFKQGMKI